MFEMMRNAWMGWTEYTAAGKLVCLLFAAVLLLWLKPGKTTHKTLAIYAGITSVLCVFPVTASLLMLYQTKFYDYIWVWNLVPVTALIALAAVSLFSVSTREEGTKGAWKKPVLAVLLFAAVVMLAGRFPVSNEKVNDIHEEYELAERILQDVPKDGSMKLWAPAEIVTCARMLPGDIRLLYGRDMWDKSLDAYSYDVYDEEVEKCYRWMENVAETGNLNAVSADHILSGFVCVEEALGRGVNIIVLPDTLKPATLKQLESLLGPNYDETEGYYRWNLLEQ